MTAEVVPFPGLTKLDLSPDRVLEGAIGELDGVVVCGIDKNGDLYTASSWADGAEALWYLERTRWRLMKVTDEIEAGER